MKRRNFLTATATLGLITMTQSQHSHVSSGSPIAQAAATEEAQAIAAEAFIYGYPLVTMELTRRIQTAASAPDMQTKRAPINQFYRADTFPDASFRDVVRPNVDTLYSNAWLDLKQEPIVLSVPDTQGRYYLLPMLDAWTNVFASPGARTTGTGAGAFAITGPGWSGTLPQGVTQIESPTNLVWMIGRTQTNGKDDVANVFTLQQGYKLIPLSQWGTAYSPPTEVPVEPNVDFMSPPAQIEAMDAVAFFSLMAALMQDNPPAAEDAPIVAKMAEIGLVPGSYEPNPLINAALVEQGVKDGLQQIVAAAQAPSSDTNTNNWTITRTGIGTYETNYLQRAKIALFGLGANVPEDALYPSTLVDGQGQPLDGQYRYVLHFDQANLPPAKAFWSLTMYDAQGYFVDNPIDRYAIGDRDNLQFNPDGSLDLYIQNESPGAAQESNWLPAPTSAFTLLLRLYWPDPAVVEGRWIPSAVERVE